MTSREDFEVWFSDIQKPAMIKSGIKLAEQNLCHKVALMAWQAALDSQQPLYDGWIDWDGDIDGDGPVSDRTPVNVKYRDGSVSAGYSISFTWCHRPNRTGWDIIAYRVVKP